MSAQASPRVPLVGADGVTPLVAPAPRTAPAQPRRTASYGQPGYGRRGAGQPYEAARWESEDMSDWHPFISSPDTENNWSRDRVVARIRDLTRNDGWANGGITKIVDSTIGGDLRPVFKPDWRSLAAQFGPSFDEVWAAEYAMAAQIVWRQWAYDPGRYCDGARRLTIPQLFAMGFRQKMRDGENLMVMLWLPERVGFGRARYCTAVQLIDADRLSNPQLMMDTPQLRGGVEIDHLGAAVAYHIRRAHPFEYFNAPKSFAWDTIPRETALGRQIVIHDYEAERIGTHRPIGGVLTPVLSRMKMLAKYDQVELQAAVLNAIMAAFIESPYDPANVQDAMGTEDVSAYQAERAEFHRERRISLNGAEIRHLFPGEKFNMTTAARPAAAFDDFEHAMLRNVASCIGLSASQLTQDWSRTNYSSARAELAEVWKTMSRRRMEFAAGTCQPIASNILEEAMDEGDLPMPEGISLIDFCQARAAFSKARWMGTPRGYIDPVKEAQAAVLRMDAGLSTLEQECAEQGHDWEDMIAQRAREIAEFKRLNIPLPSWSGDLLANQTERPE